jgi:hypothetical protein
MELVARNDDDMHTQLWLRNLNERGRCGSDGKKI